MRIFPLLPAALLAAAVVAPLVAQPTGPSDLNRVAVGAKPPAFSLKTTAGQTVTLASLTGKNVVLVFYRGYW